MGCTFVLIGQLFHSQKYKVKFEPCHALFPLICTVCNANIYTCSQHTEWADNISISRDNHHLKCILFHIKHEMSSITFVFLIMYDDAMPQMMHRYTNVLSNTTEKFLQILTSRRGLVISRSN